MSLFRIADSVYVGVTDPTAASAWYIEKLGLRQVMPTDEGEGCISLGFSNKETSPIILGPREVATDAATPMLYTANVETAREHLISRGANVGPIEQDRQGTRFFLLRDVEGNAIEVTEEP